jgi:prepilin-type N-terminal cleavage/methylation domain-containing protein
MRRGFTIIELLVVISIIALLVAMLLPALSQVRRAMQTNHCLNNHRQLLLAVRTYTNDNDSYLPFPNWLSKDDDWRDLGGAGWLYLYPSSTPNPFLPEHREGGSLWPYLGEGDVYHCPLDEDRDTGPTNHITSYVLNGAVCGFGDTKAPLPSYKTELFPGDAIFFWEVNENATSNYYNDGSSHPDEELTQRHWNGLAIGSHDGRAETIRWEDYQVGLLSRPGRQWCNPGTSTGMW